MIKDTLTYDIVGSFLRPAEIKEARKAYKDGKITKEELTQAEDLAIASLVEKEVAHGLKYVTDGEFRRNSNTVIPKKGVISISYSKA